jgi:NAD+ diphosphatase
MSFAFTARLPLSRHEIDRDHIRRSDDSLLTTLRADAAARVLPLWRGRALVADAAPDRDSGTEHLELLRPADLPATLLTLYLGLSLATDVAEPVGTPLLAAVLTDDVALAVEPDESRWVGLRQLATVLPDRDAGAFTEAFALANWHASHPCCPRCGAATSVHDGGWTRRCPACGSQVFPRTDPAVIVLVTDADDRILLGSNAMWEQNRYSLLAGFVEPGESLESAVIREMHEESGLRVTDAEYLGSQPWPFPASIMCGFTARLADDQLPHDLLPDGEEILDLRWFTRDDLRTEAGSIMLPGPSSIARALLELWLGEPLPAAPTGVRA